MIIQIPFQGFYDSWYSDELNSVEEREVEYFCEQDEYIDKDWLANEMWRFQDIRKAEEVICPKYVDAFNDYIFETFDLQLGLTFSDMSSPKEYNFTTDRIFAHISDEAMCMLFNRVQEYGLLEKTIKQRFTSCDGFHSFYSNRLEDWLCKPLSEWDHNELGTLLYALVADDNDFDYNIFSRLCDGDTFYNAFQESIDWPKFEQAITEHRLIESGECDDDGRVFPDGVADPQEYARKYCELNGLKP